METEIDIGTLPQPPAGATFRLLGAKKIGMPHFFCITPAHVAYASDHCGGILDERACNARRCGVRGCDLSYEQHEVAMTLFIAVPNNRDLNAVPGLGTYLFENKPKFIEAGIEGFAFPTKEEQPA